MDYYATKRPLVFLLALQDAIKHMECVVVEGLYEGQIRLRVICVIRKDKLSLNNVCKIEI